ncbi:GGDEF domain-containing protein [Azospirillum picis]|uniref:diguanylate cyclase n=1 Tax=Azospirillum picis TaxID=488438 RepID=A0ABU0MLF6_9PROT|nr:GGDEF domain-containing protein [Azospirillum picis]MBP2300420.1 diguanylate cyclase (GGDEF)-like protein [Azospirillum picis]MDQ0534216.1 diguanylate cyclase (GGDEF)-like protein [Azospirillum picis]
MLGDKLHAAFVRGDELPNLISPAGHTPILQRRRAAMIQSRVRMVAVVFGVLTPLWIVIDVTVFDWTLAVWLILLRLAASAAFLALALDRRTCDDLPGAWRRLAALLAIPTLFFGISHPLLYNQGVDDLRIAVSAGYGYLPFVMVAGLSVFPLTVVEGALFAAPMLAAHLSAGFYGSLVMPFPSYISALWLLALIAVVATLAAISQLHFMIALLEQAAHDALTGAFSRRIGEELLKLQVAHAERTAQPLAAIFVDLDDFKAVNDRFGHDEGDRVLRHAANTIRSLLRQSDALVRWGGEEFLVIMPDTAVDGAMIAVGRMRRAGFGRRPDGSLQTASIGVAEQTADRAADWESLVELADQRMYRAKQDGKNRVVATGAGAGTGAGTGTGAATAAGGSDADPWDSIVA